MQYRKVVYIAIICAASCFGIVSNLDTREVAVIQGRIVAQTKKESMKQDNLTIGTENTIININTADSKELEKLYKIGPKTAEKIIEYRTKNGRFKNKEDIMNVSGIGEKTYEKVKEFIVIQ